jgi:hypothetical protein
MSDRYDVIERLWESSGHGTTRQDIERAYDAGYDALAARLAEAERLLQEVLDDAGAGKIFGAEGEVSDETVASIKQFLRTADSASPCLCRDLPEPANDNCPVHGEPDSVEARCEFCFGKGWVNGIEPGTTGTCPKCRGWGTPETVDASHD